MRFLTDRKVIAKAINIDGTPVIRIDITKEMPGYENCYEGDRVVVIHKDGHDTRCTVEMFSDQENSGWHSTPWLYPRIVLMPETICIHSDFGYSDVMETYEWSKAVRVREGQEVIVLFDAGSGRGVWLRKMKMGRAAKWVYPTARLEDLGEADEITIDYKED